MQVQDFASYLVNAIQHGQANKSRFGFTNTRRQRTELVGKIVDVTRTVRGISLKLDNGKTAIVKCKPAVADIVMGNV